MTKLNCLEFFLRHFYRQLDGIVNIQNQRNRKNSTTQEGEERIRQPYF